MELTVRQALASILVTATNLKFVDAWKIQGTATNAL